MSAGNQNAELINCLFTYEGTTFSIQIEADSTIPDLLVKVIENIKIEEGALLKISVYNGLKMIDITQSTVSVTKYMERSEFFSISQISPKSLVTVVGERLDKDFTTTRVFVILFPLKRA
jgi:5'(3')-deoxyribonucleotidase